ncbi:Syntenin-1 isoform X2 [Oopsacas minuta]|uniref:Syntenin-1 isoform X2 n=1 Tax=Oopsacas minuta TaxID=111878 RepID=A0AAV7KGE2_9METZ|nr:Syntenin-1 isoform X2 [Oopsacas minuta]
MANIYPSLEDMVVDKMAKTQTQFAEAITPQQPALPAQPYQPPVHVYPSTTSDRAPPAMHKYSSMRTQHQIVPAADHQLAKQGACTVVAPVSGTHNPDIQRAEIKQGVREVILCKAADGKVGISIKDINKGVFVAYVRKGSPGAMAGLRSYWVCFQKWRICQIIKDSSAARNGILINHYLIEVNGQNVVGLKDKDIQEIFGQAPRTLAITIMPDFVYDVIMKHMGSTLKKSMDHSIPDI